jgi:hypothetical protein
MPTVHACDNGSHDCDPASTRCAHQDGASYTCACKEGYISPTSTSSDSEDDRKDDERRRLGLKPQHTSCVRTIAPTAAPTHMPTLHACDDGSHECDPASTHCEKQEGRSYICACKEGFVTHTDSGADSGADSGVDERRELGVTPLSTSCIATPAPTGTPTKAPTHMPTLHICNSGAHGCDMASTLCEKHGSLFNCACKEGYTTDPASDKRCVATDSPTAVPTTMPTYLPTAQPSPLLWEPLHSLGAHEDGTTVLVSSDGLTVEVQSPDGTLLVTKRTNNGQIKTVSPGMDTRGGG